MADKKVEAKKGSGKKSWFSRVKQYWKDTAAELKKVVWPTAKQTTNSTIVAVVVMVGAAVVLWAFDAAADAAVKALINIFA